MPTPDEATATAKVSLDNAIAAYVAASESPDWHVTEYVLIVEGMDLDSGKQKYFYAFRKNNNLATVEGLVHKLLRWIEARH